MKTLPASPSLDHLKKQAKHLLRDALAADPAALTRFMETLPAVRGQALHEIAGKRLLLHDAQSVIAREYGFPSWPELKGYVEWKAVDRGVRLASWLNLVYEGQPRQRRLALRMAADEPEFFAGDPRVACAMGDEATLRAAIAADPAWVNRPLPGPAAMPPLVAVTHSLLIHEAALEPGLLGCARLLLDHGADVNGFRPEGEWKLTALYGAAGKTWHPGMTRLLLEAGADPDDNESLYHSVETAASMCTRLLLDAGARVKGTNALGRVLDFDKLDDLKAMLAHGGDANERACVHHAILRGRSIESIQVLFDAGADMRRTNEQGISLYRYAQLHGRPDVVALLEAAGVDEALHETEQFIAACTRGDVDAARAFGTDALGRLDAEQLKTLPEMAAIGNLPAVRTMVALGWPLEVKTAWEATALNLAVFRGDAAVTELLLRAGANWQTRHGFNSNVIGTLSWASQSENFETTGDYPACARVLIASGIPLAAFDEHAYSAEVAEVLEEARLGISPA